MPPALCPPNTAVPLYHPAMFYQQLMSDSKSRVDACPHDVRAPLAGSLCCMDVSGRPAMPGVLWKQCAD